MEKMFSSKFPADNQLIQVPEEGQEVWQSKHYKNQDWDTRTEFISK